jgi:hypothetical protein
MSAVVLYTTVTQLNKPGHPQIPAAWVWDYKDPFAVRLRFATHDWVLSWELLAEALVTIDVIGEGDVRFWPSSHPGFSVMELDSPAGYGSYRIDDADVKRFLDRAATFTPADFEFELDEWLARELAS